MANQGTKHPALMGNPCLAVQQQGQQLPPSLAIESSQCMLSLLWPLLGIRQGILGHVPTAAAGKASSSFYPSALRVRALPGSLQTQYC